MTIKVFSPKWFFQDQLSIEDQETTKELFSDFLNNDDNFLNPKGWNCTVKTSWGHDNNTYELWQSWLKCIKPTMDRFVQHVGTKCDVDITMENGWANKYEVGDYQQILVWYISINLLTRQTQDLDFTIKNTQQLNC